MIEMNVELWLGYTPGMGEALTAANGAAWELTIGGIREELLAIGRIPESEPERFEWAFAKHALPIARLVRMNGAVARALGGDAEAAAKADPVQVAIALVAAARRDARQTTTFRSKGTRWIGFDDGRLLAAGPAAAEAP